MLKEDSPSDKEFNSDNARKTNEIEKLDTF